MKAVALWWHNNVAVLCGAEFREQTVRASETPAAALLALLGELPTKPTALRLVYQPQDLSIQAVDCPNGSRKSIQQALAQDHPDLTSDLKVWACQPLVATPMGASTVLSHERTPHLKRLVEALAKQRIRLEGAFPIIAVLERLPAFAMGDGPAIAVLHTATLCLLYTRDSQGARNAATIAEAADTEARAIELYGTHLSTFHVAPSVAVVHSTSAPWNFEAPNVTVAPVDLSRFLQEAENIPLGSLSNFLPPSHLPSPSTLATIAAAIVILISGVTIFRHEVRLADERAQALLKADRRSTLELEFSTRRTNQANIARSTAFAADIGSSPAGLTSLLAFLDAELPRELTLSDLRFERGVFTIEGAVHAGEGTAEGPFFAFFDSLSAPSRPWQITTKKPSTAALTFSLSGSFR